MDRQGYIDFVKQHSTKKSAKASSYAMALKILDELLPYQDKIDLQGRSLYDISDIPTLENLFNLVLDEKAKIRSGKQSIFDYGKANQKSYPLSNFCSAALNNLKSYAEYEQDLEADKLVVIETNAQTISRKLTTFFDITKEGDDRVALTKQRRGQEYFRRTLLPAAPSWRIIVTTCL